MEKKIIFWKDSEIQACKTSIAKFKGNVTKAAIWLAPRLNRPLSGVRFKMYSVNKIDNPTSNRKVRTKRVETPQNALALPKGFSFDFLPTRAEMHKDHIKLFF